MISYIKGAVLSKEERSLIIVIDDRIGYRVHVTNHILEAAHFNQEIALYVHTYVREEALDLYGFTTPEELRFFEQLISISGVGPKSAMGVLSIAGLSDIKKAIIHGDPKLLQKVSSIGKKIAERIIIELKEKINVSEKEAGGISITDNIQLLEALQALGYKEAEIRRTIQLITPEAKDISDRIKEALRLLSVNR